MPWPTIFIILQQAQKIGKADVNRLLKDRKLVLLVDLDQTLIHTTNDNIPANIKDVYHFQLYGTPHSPWYHTRLRPGTHRFLQNMSPYFELHICTFGARNYAHMIAMFLDQDGKLFSQRILSRDECFNPTSKTANLKALFPCGDDLVCIIDDREDVWSHASNLIHVKPYHFFQHTGDINAPPGLDKHENDEKEGVDLTKVNSDSKRIKVNGKINDKSKETEEDVEEAVKEGEVAEEDKKEEAVENESLEENVEKDDEEDVTREEIKKEETAENVKKVEKDVTQEEVKKEETVCTEEKSQDVSEEIKETVEELAVIKESEADETINKEKMPQEDVAQHAENGEKLISNNVGLNNGKGDKEEEMVEIDDPDDYLLYLEDILKEIHKAFYDNYDKMKSGRVPDLKKVIPEVRKNVLNDTKLVFSGLVPTHIKLEQSKAYQVARSLGAIVTQDLKIDTTHLVAVRPGTAKVNAGRRKKNLKIVTPDWLWSCAERWSKVDERLYNLSNKGSKNRHPPPHCSSPEHSVVFDELATETPGRKRTASGRFMDTINPLMSFSSADIADMDREVEDIFNESESDGENSGNKKTVVPECDEVFLPDEVLIDAVQNVKSKGSDDSSSSSEESMTGEHPHGWKPHEVESRERKRSREDDAEDESTADEFPSTKFRRGEELSSDLDIGQGSNSDGSVEPPDEIDDGDWNMMGAALEREFLSNN